MRTLRLMLIKIFFLAFCFTFSFSYAESLNRANFTKKNEKKSTPVPNKILATVHWKAGIDNVYHYIPGSAPPVKFINGQATTLVDLALRETDHFFNAIQIEYKKNRKNFFLLGTLSMLGNKCTFMWLDADSVLNFTESGYQVIFTLYKRKEGNKILYQTGTRKTICVYPRAEGPY